MISKFTPSRGYAPENKIKRKCKENGTNEQKKVAKIKDISPEQRWQEASRYCVMATCAYLRKTSLRIQPRLHKMWKKVERKKCNFMKRAPFSADTRGPPSPWTSDSRVLSRDFELWLFSEGLQLPFSSLSVTARRKIHPRQLRAVKIKKKMMTSLPASPYQPTVCAPLY